MRFFLGSHRPARMGVPLFVSDRTLRRCARLPRAVAPWSLDSGGFTELQRYGSWDFGPSPASALDVATAVGLLGGGLAEWAAQFPMVELPVFGPEMFDERRR